MAIDRLQEKIRKTKNPSVIELPPPAGRLPKRLVQENSAAQATVAFCQTLLCALKGVVPAVRFRFCRFAILGADGIGALQKCLNLASELGYYCLLDAPELFSTDDAQQVADTLLGAQEWNCDGLLISAYLGSDAIKPFLPYCKDRKKDLFLLARTSNRSASEIQDLLAGGRHVHIAAADLAARYGDVMLGKCGYTNVGIVAAAGAAESTRVLREKYRHTFLLLEGFDYPSANAKKCSYAFDRLGHGAAVCAGESISCAWEQTQEEDYAGCALQAAERMKKNLTGYAAVL